MLYPHGPHAGLAPSGIHKWELWYTWVLCLCLSGFSVSIQSSQTCDLLLWGSSPLFWKLKGHDAYLWLGLSFQAGKEAYLPGIFFLNSSVPVSGLPK